METLINIIHELNAVATDPVTRWLLICATILIVLTIVSIIISAIKRLFYSIFSLLTQPKKKKKKKPSKKPAEKPVPQEVKVEKVFVPVEPTDTHLEDAERTLGFLRNTIDTFMDPAIPGEILKPMTLNTPPVVPSPKTINDINYQVTDDDTTAAQKLTANKSLSELHSMLAKVRDALHKNEVTRDMSKNRFADCFEKHDILLKAEESAITAYNQQVLETRNIVEEGTQIIKGVQNRIAFSENTISRLINEERRAIDAQKSAKEQLISEIAEVTPKAEGYSSLKTKTENDIQNCIAEAASCKTLADKSIMAREENSSAIAELQKKIIENNKELAINKLHVIVITEAINHLKDEEVKRFNEQKRREEEAAKAKAEEESKRAKELFEEEAKKRAEDQKRIEEALKARHTSTSDGDDAANDAAMAQFMINEQRRKRAEAAKNRTLQAQGGSVESESSGNKPTNQSASTADGSDDAEVNNTQPVEAEENDAQNELMDPIERIKDGWKREREAKEAMSAGNVDKAIDLMNGTSTSNK